LSTVKRFGDKFWFQGESCRVIGYVYKEDGFEKDLVEFSLRGTEMPWVGTPELLEVATGSTFEIPPREKTWLPDPKDNTRIPLEVMTNGHDQCPT
jgi:hypothetical protein